MSISKAITFKIIILKKAILFKVLFPLQEKKNKKGKKKKYDYILKQNTHLVKPN